ncbi:nucleoid-associated protein [Flavisolibacter ginsenosidimutans]|uniref:Nucleoid-associated protein n=1 Tax=Flavisolibacter ginsenosidimutans TaxID=661481 RepID=A0A5B8UJR8_9BACT|nr:nucleoid-associated protein [Flavisolibacter ginsenosidimutans]QEC56937.1 nucleoid-associated protein [Flavisolibacter ginsenosidimutans]
MNLQNTPLQSLIVHFVGNKNNAGPLHLSQKTLELSDDLKMILGDSFLSRFKNNFEWHQFSHESSLQFNEAYNYCKQIFSDADLFEEVSQAIAKHLYNQSTHPKVKGGELYVAYFDALPVESRMCKAIGLFKTENKTLFLEADQTDANIGVQLKEGIELTKIDKGCLIINQKEDEGFDVLLFDNQNRGEEAQYWKEKFLSLSPQKNEFHNTQHLLNLTKQFITGPLETEMHIGKNEQVNLLHKSIDYFKTNESFDIDDFQAKVFIEDDRIDAFRNFGSRYVENNDFDLAAQFDISPEAVKKQSRIFKSVIKLDRNFHIYVHGRTDLIEKGVDLDGRKYYKIFYQDEA